MVDLSISIGTVEKLYKTRVLENEFKKTQTIQQFHLNSQDVGDYS